MNRRQWSSATDVEGRLRDALESGPPGSVLDERVLARLRGRSPRRMVRDRAAATVRRTSLMAALVLAVLAGFLLVGAQEAASSRESEPRVENPVIVMFEGEVAPSDTTPTTVLASLLLGE